MQAQPKCSESSSRGASGRLAERFGRTVVALFRVGATQAYIAKKTGISRVTINKWFAKYRRGGLEAVLRAAQARESSFSDANIEELRQAVMLGPTLNGISRAYWTHHDIGTLIERRFGLHYSLGTVRILLRRAKLDRSNCACLTRPPRPSPGPPRPPGRPRRVSLQQVRELGFALRAPPKASGLAAAEWTPDAVAQLIRERFGATYCTGYIRRLLRGAGIEPDAVMRWKKRVMPLGRRRRVAPERVRELEPTLRASPRASGVSADEWTPDLVAALIRARLGGAYSAGHIPFVLRAAGMDPDTIIVRRSMLMHRRASRTQARKRQGRTSGLGGV